MILKLEEEGPQDLEWMPSHKSQKGQEKETSPLELPKVEQSPANNWILAQ